MTLLTVAIVVHVLSVVWWIGGLAFVTAVILPALRTGLITDPRAAFESIESRFAPQARVVVILVGLSGLYLLIRLNLWTAFSELRFWWLDAMVLFWLSFFLLLFVLDPTGFLKRVMRGSPDRAVSWIRMERLHRVLLAVALIIIAGAVSGSHGF
jgi:uncharacterized membrane protein